MVWLLDLIATVVAVVLTRRMAAGTAWRVVHVLAVTGFCLAVGLAGWIVMALDAARDAAVD